MSEPTIYDRVGAEKLLELSRKFYERAAADPIIGPMLPQDDLEGAVERQALFLIQLFGGPPTYSAQRGHPRLRARHLPFSITREARDRWIEHMTAALDDVGITGDAREEMERYFDRAASFMINTQDAEP